MSQLDQYFEFDGVKRLTHFLGTSIESTPNGLLQHNEPLIRAAATAVGVLDANPKYVPFPSGTKITDETSIPEEVESYGFGYRNVLGMASYVGQRTRPEISFHCSTLASKQANPNAQDYHLLKHLVKYLYTTIHYRQSLQRTAAYSRGGLQQELCLTATCDSDYAGCPVTYRSMSGLNITLNSSNDTNFPLLTSVQVFSSAKRQLSTTQSSNEAELVAATEAAKTLVYLQYVLDFMDDNTATPRLYCDNRGAIEIAHSLSKRKRSKHIHVRHFYIRELIKEGKIILRKVDTNDNVSDAMTKSLGKNKFVRFRKLLDIIPPSPS